MREHTQPITSDITIQQTNPALTPTVIEIRATAIPTIAVPNALPNARVV
jgi:hypothetical protein